MSSIEIMFGNPWLLLVAIPAFAIILIPFLRLPEKRRKTVKKIVPVVLHMIVVTVLVLILAGFNVVRISDEQAVIMLVDMSDSTENVQEEIKQYGQQILDLMEKEVPIGVVAFGENSIYSIEIGKKNQELEIAEIGVEATNIDAALEYASTLLPADKVGRIIILSDGKETDGDAYNTARYLATQGIRIDAVYFDTATLTTEEMQINSFVAPEGAYVGDELVFTAEIKSNVDGNANLSLYDGENIISTLETSISTGSNVFEIGAKAEVSGVHSYRLTLETETDTLAQNNERYAYLNVAKGPSVLIIADATYNASRLVELLETENEVTTVVAKNAPNSIVELCKYDEVILSNVNYEELPSGYDKLLETYVSVHGRSLLTAGGEKTYMYGNMEGTALEEMLPVTLSLSEDSNGKSVALMLVLDCSSSMSRQGNFLSVAKQGAIKCVDAMSGNDYVGVISFHSRATVNSPLVQATDENKASVNRIISGLMTWRGTYYTEALKKAQEELSKSTADVKHVIFLSDGNPSDSDFYTVTSEMASAGISVSTIGLGLSSSILSGLAEMGDGRYYYVQSAYDLPDIMLSETEQVVVSSLKKGSYLPIIKEQSELTSELGTVTLPTLTGYLGTTIKEGATAYLTSTEGHPIYAAWDYGSGKVATFTSDLKADWSSEWFSSSVGQSVIKNMVGTTVDDVHRESSLSAEFQVNGKTVSVIAKTATDTAENTMSLSFSSDTDNKKYDFVRNEEGVYEASFRVEDEGVYEILISETDASGNVVDDLQTGVAVSYSKEYDSFAESGESLLINMCNCSGGKIFNDMKELASTKVAEKSLILNPMVLFGILAVILLLVDIAIRKLRWKDVNNYLIRFKNLVSKR